MALSQPGEYLWAVVPVKPLDQAKGRLAPVFDRAGRAWLARRLLRNVLDVLSSVPSIDRVLVVSRDAEALEMGMLVGACPVREAGEEGLNAAIRLGAAEAAGQGAGALLVIASDLPLLTTADLTLMLETETAVAIAPDRHGAGTNALLLRPPGIIQPAFGAASLQRHEDLARAAGFGPVRVESDGLGFDLDTPSDYAELLRMHPQWAPPGVTAALPG